jgi:hypothetical protein
LLDPRARRWNRTDRTVPEKPPLAARLLKSRRVNNRAGTIAACTANLKVHLARDPTDAEVASILAMSVQKLRKLRR